MLRRPHHIAARPRRSQGWALATTTAEVAQKRLLEGLGRRLKLQQAGQLKSITRDRCAHLDSPGAKMIVLALSAPPSAPVCITPWIEACLPLRSPRASFNVRAALLQRVCQVRIFLP